MQVKLAVQILSHTVAAGMYAKISQGLTPEAVVTANVIAKMDKLFDTLNSDTADLRRGKPLATNMKCSTRNITFINEMKLFFKNISFIGSSRKPPSQEGWVWTLNGVERLWNVLRQKHNTIKSLATRRLQQDPLENLFGCIRGNCGSNHNPTSGQFKAGLKTAILSNLSQMGGGNCEMDQNETIINNFKSFLKPCVRNTQQIADTAADPISSNQSAFNDIDENILEECSGEIQACTYVCGFIIKKFKHECNACKLIFTTTEQSIMHTFNTFKEYNDLKQVLNYANKNFVMCGEICATIVNTYLKINAHKKGLMKNIITVIKEKMNFDFLNECMEHKNTNLNYIIKSVILIIIKRYCIIRNRSFSEETSMNALKKKINILQHL
ncbi:uncharacterized protein LOC131847470 isoform X1 [Achroia grisella]|uniref:uncharacterized protein LOC131847470 isoform X1 n=1 Tax=Achroia grisella TaxID=688607 RepID=UPI0027D2E56F|nr:uncharacterized protein LOC131847470 isoform X1 [Achroia grisella]